MMLKDKVAIVTGSSRGIGRAIAERFGQEGVRVVVTYHSSSDKAQEVVDRIKTKGSDAIALQVNVKDIDSITQMFQQTIEHFGKLDILINNAAGKNIFYID